MIHARLACALFMVSLFAIDAQGADRSHSPRTLTTQFTYKVVVPEIVAGTKALDLWIPIPSNSEWQTIEDVQVEAPASHRITRERKYGNRMVFIRAENPQAPLAVTVRFRVIRKEPRVFADSISADSPGRESASLLLGPESKVPITGRFADIAKEVVGDRSKPIDKLRAIFDHVVATMQYDYRKESPHLGDGDVSFVCDYKKGNCSDFHSYLISLARSQGIPAVLEFGFPITGIPLANPIPKEGSIAGYHCWTWFKDSEKGWAPLDAADSRRWTDAKKPEMKDYLFGNLLLERSAVAFSRGRDLTLNPPQRAGPLNYFIYPYAEADGSAAKVTWEVRYALP